MRLVVQCRFGPESGDNKERMGDALWNEHERITKKVPGDSFLVPDFTPCHLGRSETLT